MRTDGVRRILAVFDDCGPGDALCLTFCLTALRKAYPEATIDLVVSARAWPIFEHADGFGRVIVSNLYGGQLGTRPPSLLSKIRELGRLAWRIGRGYDMALTFLWGTTALNLLARWAAKRSFGYSSTFPWLLTTSLGRYSPDGEPIQAAIHLLAAADVKADPEVPYIPFRREVAASAHSHLDLATNMVVVHTGSDWACQQWLPDRWAAVADTLVSRYGAQVVFTGLAEESAYIESVRSGMVNRSISLAGQTTVGDLTEILSRAAICICVDVVTYELAQAVGTRIVVLAGQSRTGAVVSGPSRPIVVNRTTPELRAAILQCKTRVEKASYGGCRNYGCPMAGLRDISVGHVLDAIEAQRALEPLRPEALMQAEG